MHYGHIHSQLGGFFVVLLAVLGLFTGGTGATSHESAPWKQVHAPENPKLRLARGVQPFQPQGTLAQRSLQQSTDLRHDDTFLLKFQVDGDAFSVIFKPSQNLIHPEARVHYSGSETPQRLRARDVRAYQGVVVQEAVVEQYWAEEVAGLVRPQSDPAVRGWARLLVRDDDEAWDGSMHVHGIRYHFKPVHRFIKESHQRHQRDGTAPLDPPLPALARRNLLGGNTVVLRSVDSDSHEQQSTAECAHDASPFNLQLSQKTAHTRRHPDIPPFFGRDSDVFSPFGSTPLIKRQGDMAGGDGNSSFEGSIGSTAGCPTENRVVYIGVAADCNAVQSLDSQDEARIQLLSYINSVSGIYQSAFNISLGVVELNVKDASCPSSAPSDEPWNVSCDADNSPDLNQRLSLFSQWRSDKGGGDGAGLWHLITTCTTSSEVGVAWLGQLCKVDASPSGSGETTSGTGVTSITQNTFEVIAHEIGHK